MRDKTASLSFDAFRLDGPRGILLDADGAELHLRPKTIALLRHFLDNPGRLLRRNDLLAALWPGMVVTDDSLTQCASELRAAFGRRAPSVLRTVPKRGYMLIADVHQDAPAPLHTVVDAPPPVPSAPRAGDIAVLRRVTMAVHRLDTSGGDPACTLLAESLTSDLVAALTCLEGIRVLRGSKTPRKATFRVCGEVRALGAELRITIRLEEVATGIALWAERLSYQRDKPPELPTVEMMSLVVHLGQQVDRHCLEEARQKAATAMSARELHLIGREHHQRGTEPDTQLAREMFDLAMARDPDYAHAYAWQAYTVSREVTHGWGGPGKHAALYEKLRLARRAVLIDPTSPLCLSRLAYALMLHQQWDDAVVTARAALKSDRPAFTAARNPCCEVLTQAGHPKEAAEIALGTLALDPLCSPITQALLGRALLLAGQAEEALQPLRWCASRLPDFTPTFDTLVVATLETNRPAEAISAWKQVLRLRPGWELINHTGLWWFRRTDDLGRFQAAYRRVAILAQLPEVGADALAHGGPAVGAGRPMLPSVSVTRAPDRDAAPSYRNPLRLSNEQTAVDRGQVLQIPKTS